MFRDGGSLVRSIAEFLGEEDNESVSPYSGYAGGTGALLTKVAASGVRVVFKPWGRTTPVGWGEIRRSFEKYEVFKSRPVDLQVHVALSFRPKALRETPEEAGLVLVFLGADRATLEIVGANKLPAEVLRVLVSFGEDRGVAIRRDTDGVVTEGKADPSAVNREAWASRTGIFIAYRRSDTEHAAGRIYDRLIQHFEPERVFKDVDSIPPGVDFRDHAMERLQSCRVAVLPIGRHFFEGDEEGQRRLDDELDHLRVEIRSILAQGISLIPLLVGDTDMPAKEDLPADVAELAFRNGVTLRGDPHFHSDMDRLLASLDELFAQVDPT